VPRLTQLEPVPVHRRQPARPAPDVRGKDLGGGAVEVVVDRPGTWTLLLFLSPRCDGCASLWSALGAPGPRGLEGVQVAAVTGALARREAATVRRQVPPGATSPVVVSPDAFGAYGVHGAPFFVLVDGDGPVVATEGVAWALDQVVADVDRARTARRA
jgi:hypothetical protein